MRILIYLLLIVLSLFISWYLGAAGHGMTSNLLIFATVIVGAAYFLTRRECLVMGSIAFFLGVVVPPILWTYGEHTGGDTSGTGMLGTILMFLFVPIGLGLSFVGWKKVQ